MELLDRRVTQVGHPLPHLVSECIQLIVGHLHWRQSEWHLHLASQADPLAQRMGAEMAMALADLIRAGELRRLKICAAPDCTAAVMDLSRNRSRIFCDTGNCGNRLHVAAYRERRAKEA